MSKTKIIRNKTLKEYEDTYPNYKDLEKHTEEEVSKNKDLLKDKTWWLIDNTYYEAKDEKKKNAIVAWWSNLGKGARTAICILGGAAVITGITVPTVIGAKSCSSEKKTVKCDSTEVNFSSGFEADGSLKATIKPSSATREISNLEIKIGDYTLKENEYSFNKESGELIISSNIVKAHKGNIVIKPTLKDKPQSTGCNIDWITNKFTDATYGFNNETVYEKATASKHIVFKKDSSTSGVQVGETNNDKVYASFADNTLTIWSNEKIKFNDNDLQDDWEGRPKTSAFFKDCPKLSSIELNNIDTSEVTSLADLFSNDSALVSVDLSNLDTSKVKNMRSLFYSCGILGSVKFGFNFNTAKCENMSMMFTDCYNLRSLDLTSFDTKEVNNMSSMFSGSYNLEKILVSNKFVTEKVTSSENMFYDCKKLLGEKGTAYDSTKIDVNYAHIDAEGNPGYFTSEANKPTRTSFIETLNNFQSAFANDVGKYENTQLKLNKWQGTEVNEDITNISYSSSPRNATITTATSITSPFRIDANSINSTDLESKLLPETDSRVKYEIVNNYIDYIRNDNTNEGGIYRIKINKYGYIQELEEKGGSNISYSINYTDFPDFENVETINLVYTGTGSSQSFTYDGLTLDANKKCIFNLTGTGPAGGFSPTKMKIEDTSGNIDLSQYLILNDERGAVYINGTSVADRHYLTYDASNKYLECDFYMRLNNKIIIRTLSTVTSTTNLKVTVYK